MKRNVFVSRQFTICFLCLFILLLAFVCINFCVSYHTQQDEYNSRISEKVHQRLSFFDTQISTVVSSCNNIFACQWYKHYSNAANLYQDEFSVVVRSNTNVEIRNRLLSLFYISDLLICFPSKNTVVNKTGWYTMEDYSNYYGVPLKQNGKISSEEDLQAQSGGKTIYLQIFDPQNRKPEQYLFAVIDKNKYAHFIENVLDEETSFFQVTYRDLILYQRGTSEKEHLNFEWNQNSLGLCFEIEFPSYSQAALPILLMQSSMFLFASLIAAAILSWIFTRFAVIPLHHVLQNAAEPEQRTLQDAYQAIEDFLWQLSTENTEMHSHIEQLQHMVETCKRQDRVTEKSEQQKKLATEVLDFIERNYANPDMTIDMLSTKFSINGTNLSKLIKKHGNTTFSEYLQHLRLQKACELLDSTEESATTITSAVGYSSYPSFKRAFIREMGISPVNWRQEQKDQTSVDSSLSKQNEGLNEETINE